MFPEKSGIYKNHTIFQLFYCFYFVCMKKAEKAQKIPKTQVNFHKRSEIYHLAFKWQLDMQKDKPLNKQTKEIRTSPKPNQDKWVKHSCTRHVKSMQQAEDGHGSLRKLGFVHVPGSPPLALGVFVASHSLSVDFFSLFFPAQVLQLLFAGRGDAEISQHFGLLKRVKYKIGMKYIVQENHVQRT